MYVECEQRLRYNLKVWHKKDDLDIPNKISEYVTLVQLMDLIVNLNPAISILGYFVFDSNYEKSLCLTK